MTKKCLMIALLLCCLPSLQAANIVFADPVVKQLCVAAWDTDGDGELSTDEAAAVASLGGVFRDNKSIDSFEELRYFTGLSAIDDHAFYQSSLRSVAFPATVAEIGEYAFSQSGLSGELRVPGTVKAVRNYAFDSCQQLTSVVLEEGVETVGWHSFSGPIGTLSLPSTLTFMSSMAVNPYVNAAPSSGLFIPVGDLYVYVHSAVPAPINDYAFYYVFNAAHLVVPFDSADAYKAAAPWAYFGEYLELGDVNMDGYFNNRDVISTRAYVLGNAPSPFNKVVADMNGDGVVNNRDVVLLRNAVMQ